MSALDQRMPGRRRLPTSTPIGRFSKSSTTTTGPSRRAQLGKKILVTNLANTVQPFIRYEVGDQVSVAEGECRCGSRLPRVAHVEGRAAEIFWVSRRQRPSNGPRLALPQRHRFAGQIREWQAIQPSATAWKSAWNCMPEQSLLGCLRRGRPAAEAPIAGTAGRGRRRCANCSPPSPDPVTNKFRRMLSEVGPPDDLATRPSHRRHDSQHVTVHGANVILSVAKNLAC